MTAKCSLIELRLSFVSLSHHKVWVHIAGGVDQLCFHGSLDDDLWPDLSDQTTLTCCSFVAHRIQRNFPPAHGTRERHRKVNADRWRTMHTSKFTRRPIIMSNANCRFAQAFMNKLLDENHAFQWGSCPMLSSSASLER